MNEEPKLPSEDEVEWHIRQRTAELLRSNEALREELTSLREDAANLTQRLDEARSGLRADRESRRAALNLMEDAIQAREEMVREIAERRRVEEELRDADRRKDEFLATLAHELRTPLAPIRNSLGILRLTGVENASSQHVCEMLERQVNHMVRLVDDLLEVSRITRGIIELRKEGAELAAVVQNAVEASKPLIESAGHRLTISLPSEPIILNADPVRIAQVFTNLLNNAAKFTKAGEGQICLRAARNGSSAVVSVKDNGRGIPAEMLPKVFDLFTQVDRNYNRSQSGLGIGLTLVRSLVEMHGGQVAVKSEGPDLGSEFIVRLPIEVAPARRNARNACGSAPTPIAPRRMLVVDDNQDAAESLGVLLKLLGATVSTAHDGAAALEAMRNDRPSVVLLDIGMPVMDGIEVARRARERPEGRDVTLIALTGWGQEADRRRSHDAGFDFHLVKPVDLAALREILASLPQDQV
jgi:signal transduction histidine kinase